jgi:folate-binding protein YgfZ
MPETTVDQLAEYERLERDGGRCTIDRDVVSVTGPDAGRYLQGQLSQDVVAMAGSSAWSLLLQPTGKVEAWLRVSRRTDIDYVLDVDAGFGDLVVARLRRFLLRTKAEIAEPARRQFTVVRGPAARLVLDAEADAPPRSGDDRVGGPAAGPGVSGIDVMDVDGPKVIGDLATSAGSQAVSTASYERYRIAHGVPAMGAELTEDTIPAEAGQWLIDASVSFTKGCYTGQELVARIDSRGGNVPRPIRLLRVDRGPMPVVGSEVHSGDAVVGRVTSATPHLGPHQPALALGPLARSVELGATLEVVTDAGEAVVTVVEPPFVGHGPG